jgi:hypothetical protein
MLFHYRDELVERVINLGGSGLLRLWYQVKWIPKLNAESIPQDNDDHTG